VHHYPTCYYYIISENLITLLNCRIGTTELGKKRFRGVMIGYPHDAPGYRICNPVTRRITTSVHVVVQEDTPGFGTRPTIDSLITDAWDTDDALDHSPLSHPLVPDTHDVDDAPRLLDLDRPRRLRSHPI
jgi:hypothetical protein